MEKINKIMIRTIFVVISVIFMCIITSAVGINGPYLEDKTLYLMPGQSEDLKFFIQNGGSSPQDSNADAVIISGGEVFRITDEKTEYFVPIGKFQPVNTIVEIPAGTPLNSTYDAIIRFTITPLSGTAGTLTFGSSIDQTFKIVVGERPKPQLAPVPKEPNYTLFLIVLVIIVILILFILLYFSKRKKKTENIPKQKKMVKSK